jgi:hypothetical protein
VPVLAHYVYLVRYLDNQKLTRKLKQAQNASFSPPAPHNFSGKLLFDAIEAVFGRRELFKCSVVPHFVLKLEFPILTLNGALKKRLTFKCNENRFSSSWVLSVRAYGRTDRLAFVRASLEIAKYP